MPFIGLIIGVLALVAAVQYRARLQRALGRKEPVLSDDLVRQIEESGWVEVDEPLDLDEIQEEEARFWEDRPWEETEENGW